MEGSRARAFEADAATNAREAIDRARTHAFRAAAESVAALQALLDAGSFATFGVPAESQPSLARIGAALESVQQQLASGGSGLAPGLVDTVLIALDTEIARWELRSRDDADARAVLRAFLGLREILWEVGFRPADRRAESDAEHDAEPRKGRGSRAARRGRRVQRVDVQG